VVPVGGLEPPRREATDFELIDLIIIYFKSTSYIYNL
jgi:hypothetical protein